MFRAVFPSITRSQQYLYDIRLLQYVQSLTSDDGRKDRPKHVECSQVKQLWDIVAASWFYYGKPVFESSSYSHNIRWWGPAKKQYRGSTINFSLQLTTSELR